MSTKAQLHDFVEGKDGIERCSICHQTLTKKSLRFPRYSECSPATKRVSGIEADLMDFLHGSPNERNTDDERELVDRTRNRGRYAGAKSADAAFLREAARLSTDG